MKGIGGRWEEGYARAKERGIILPAGCGLRGEGGRDYWFIRFIKSNFYLKLDNARDLGASYVRGADAQEDFPHRRLRLGP